MLERHTDEVWFVAFSHDGRLLASASKDMLAIVWDVQRPDAPHRVLCGHTEPLLFVAWSPDDTQLLTCGNDRVLKLCAPRTRGSSRGAATRFRV